jgi:DNA polymerase V
MDIYRPFGISKYPSLCDNIAKLIGAALAGLKQIQLVGLSYKNTGVLLMGLHPKSSVQRNLFDDPAAQDRSDNMIGVMDAINCKMGMGSVTVASSGVRQGWAMRQEKKSPNYTTEWAELPVARQI